MADVELSPEAAVVASKIRTIDRDLDQRQKDREESIVRGMRAPSGAAVVNKWVRTALTRGARSCCRREPNSPRSCESWSGTAESLIAAEVSPAGSRDWFVRAG